jgi:threonine/homoserine/homoserine lactone efflux protein
MTILSFGALFAGLGVASSDPGAAAFVTLGVLLGSSAWWVVLTSVVSGLRTRITPSWVRRINIASGIAIGAFALLSIAIAVS